MLPDADSPQVDSGAESADSVFPSLHCSVAINPSEGALGHSKYRGYERKVTVFNVCENKACLVGGHGGVRQPSSPCSPRGGCLAGTGRDPAGGAAVGEGCAGMSQDTGRCFPTVSARSARTNTRLAASLNRTHRRTHSPAPKLGHVTEWPLPGLVAPRTGKQAHTGPGMMTYSRERVRGSPGERRPQGGEAEGNVRGRRWPATCGSLGTRHNEAPCGPLFVTE